MKRAIMLVFAVGLATACTERLPTGIEPQDVPQAQYGAVATSSARAQADDTFMPVDDALDRIVPGLSRTDVAQPLAAALAGLRTGMRNADATALPGLLDAARNAVQRYARTGMDEAELDAIRMAIDAAAESWLVNH